MSYVVELLKDQDNALIRSDQITKNTTLEYKNILVGKYKIRVIYDTNRNSKWDTGSVKENRQPENIWMHPKIMIFRPNFEVAEDAVVPQETSP